MSKMAKASLIGRDYEIDKKTSRPKRRKRDGRSSRDERGGTDKGEN